MYRYKSETQSTFLIVPFAIKSSYEETIEKITNAEFVKKKNNESEKIWKEESFNQHRLFAHINRLIDKDSIHKNEAIGTRFALKHEARATFNLPKNNNDLMEFTPDGQKFQFAISGVHFYLFETQTGFVVFDIKYPIGQEIDDIILCNYYLKKIYQYKDELRYFKRTGKNTYDEEKVSFCQLVQEFLSNVTVDTYFEEIKKLPSYALIYSSVLMDSNYNSVQDNNKQLLTYLFRMRRSFKETYAAAPSEYDPDNNDEIIQLFENSFWGVSLEGAAHIAYLKNDESDTFFKETHAANIRDVYFYLYILVLNQYYTLQYFSILASRLPATLEEYLEDKKDAQKDMESLKSKMVFFILRCSFKQVSFITHQTALYEMFRRVLRIEDLMDELHLEIEALSSITEMEKSKRSKKIENIILAVTTGFVILSTINDSTGLISFIDNSHWPANKSYTPWIATPLWGGIGLGGIYLVRKILELRKK
ncbi:hypothetical protein [Neobacillus dielmonensis]|uniref:hypothetical protein n=1 Tax=Neobacillus dielmonensis TaxID=1347369 RepID=UPI0012B5AB8E|nr:hypothetical protein [Neobacillus dielmonensis]